MWGAGSAPLGPWQLCQKTHAQVLPPSSPCACLDCRAPALVPRAQPQQQHQVRPAAGPTVVPAAGAGRHHTATQLTADPTHGNFLPRVVETPRPRHMLLLLWEAGWAGRASAGQQMAGLLPTHHHCVRCTARRDHSCYSCSCSSTCCCCCHCCCMLR